MLFAAHRLGLVEARLSEGRSLRCDLLSNTVYDPQ